MCSRRWVWEQYDHLIQSNTAQIPGGDAGVVRIRGNKAIAVSTDVTPRYVEADPFEGGKQAVAECWRNLTAVGAAAHRDHRQPELRQSRNAPRSWASSSWPSRASRHACRALDFPVVSGNVSLYNETNGQGILPTPAIGGIGLLDRPRRKWPRWPSSPPATTILLIGGHGTHLGQSIYLREVLGREEGAPPPVDLAVEKRNGDFVRNLINTSQVSAVHDVSDGGLGLAVIEMALASGLGASLHATDPRTALRRGPGALCRDLRTFRGSGDLGGGRQGRHRRGPDRPCDGRRHVEHRRRALYISRSTPLCP